MKVLEQIEVPGAWQAAKGSGVTVAVLDTGVDSTAPDLAGQVTTGPDYMAGADPAGYQPPLEHGTYIASLIAGHGSGPGDTLGVIGVAPQAKILSVRVILDDGEPGMQAYNQDKRFADAIGKGIYYAVRHGATSSTCPWAPPSRPPTCAPPSPTRSAGASWSSPRPATTEQAAASPPTSTPRRSPG